MAEPHRVQALDVLRGLAILGVLVANMQLFAYPMVSSGPDVADWEGTGAGDGLALLLVGLLVECKLFTLLGLAILVVLFRQRKSINVEDLDAMRG